jgi:hypothetical protein
MVVVCEACAEDAAICYRLDHSIAQRRSDESNGQEKRQTGEGSKHVGSLASVAPRRTLRRRRPRRAFDIAGAHMTICRRRPPLTFPRRGPPLSLSAPQARR